MRFLVLSFLVFLLSNHGAVAALLPGPQLQAVSADFFKPQQVWHWKYYQDGKLYSTERYTVLEASPTRVLIQMSTKLPGQDQFFVHHLQEVNPQRCLRAHQNPADYRPWSIKLYYKADGHWELVDGLTTTAAFEEKFNCNPHRVRNNRIETFVQMRDTDLGPQELFQQRKNRQDDRSWYFNLPEYPGIMAFKRMSRPEEKVQYEIRFSLSE